MSIFSDRKSHVINQEKFVCHFLNLIRTRTAPIFFLYNLQNKKVLDISKDFRWIKDHHLFSFLKKLWEKIHPDDRSTILKIYDVGSERNNLSYDKSKLSTQSYQFRVGRQGDWIWLTLNLEVLSYSEENFIERLFGSLNRELRLEETEKMEQRRISGRVVRKLKCQYWEVSLREREVLKLVADGFSSKQIAGKLHISPHTAISHRKNLITKFRVKNTAELIKEATRTLEL